MNHRASRWRVRARFVTGLAVVRGLSPDTAAKGLGDGVHGMESGDNVVFLDPGRFNSHHADLLRQLKSVAREGFGRVLTGALDRSDDVLFDRADRAGADAEQERYFIAMRQIRMRRREVETAFHRELDRAFDRVLADTATGREADGAPEIDPTALELMDEAAVEREVATDSAVARLRARYALPLAQLCMRMDHLVSDVEVDDGNNPLDPATVMAAFSSSTSRLDVEIAPLLILYKLFEKQAMAQLAEVYDQANQFLIDAGILPTLRGAGPAQRGSGPASTTDERRSTAHEADEALLQTVLDLVARSKGWQDSGGVGSAPSAGVRYAETAAVLDILSALQSGAERGGADGDSAAVAPEQVKAFVLERLNGDGETRRLERAADDTIDIVGMLFDIILDDPRLHDSVKLLISRLQIPVIRVALADTALFADRQHPVRRLLDEMAFAAAGWNEPEEPDSDPLFRKMRACVERVLDAGGDLEPAFAASARDLTLYLDTERQRADLVEERTRQSAEGKARVDEARERVQREIELRLNRPGLPAVVHRLLEEAWFKVLSITALKEGVGSEAWEHQMAVMDRLVWSVEHKPEPEERRRMLGDMPRLLHDLREGLNGILFNPFEMTRLFRELEAEHLRLLSVPPGQVDDSDRPEPDTFDVQDANAILDEVADAEDDPVVARLQEVAIGTWFDFRRDDDRGLRAKLSARVADDRRFVFVNRAGFKVAERGLRDLAEGVRDGSIRILDHGALFDRAMAEMARALGEAETTD